MKENREYILSNVEKIHEVLNKLANSEARCRTCANPGNNLGIKYFDEILE